LEIWRQYFQELYGDEKEIIGRTRTGKNRKHSSEQMEDHSQENTTEITKEEIENGIKKTEMERAAGHDSITPEQIKHMGNYGKEHMHKLLNLVWKKKCVPEDWKIAVIITIFKKGNNRECHQHRGISLLNVPSKIYTRILDNRLREQVEDTLEDSQYGFRKNRSMQDAIFVIRQLTDKTINFDKEMHLRFIDLEKAFDRINRSEVFGLLRKRKINKELIQAIESYYKQTNK
jgi:hypothetical protein